MLGSNTECKHPRKDENKFLQHHVSSTKTRSDAKHGTDSLVERNSGRKVAIRAIRRSSIFCSEVVKRDARLEQRGENSLQLGLKREMAFKIVEHPPRKERLQLELLPVPEQFFSVLVVDGKCHVK